MHGQRPGNWESPEGVEVCSVAEGGAERAEWRAQLNPRCSAYIEFSLPAFSGGRVGVGGRTVFRRPFAKKFAQENPIVSSTEVPPSPADFAGCAKLPQESDRDDPMD